MLKKGDFIELEYTGRLKEEGLLFDTTDEALAKKEGSWGKNMTYGPIIICLGEKQIIAGLDKNLEGKGLGKHKVDLAPEDAFGKKDPKLLKMIPSSTFRKQEINPMPGLQLNIDGVIGTVRTVAGGRVIVDFNHPLSGKEVSYDINVKRIVTDEKEKVSSFIKLALGLKDFTVELKGSEAEVTADEDIPKEFSDKLSEKLGELTGVKKITFKKRSSKEKETKK